MCLIWKGFCNAKVYVDIICTILQQYLIKFMKCESKTIMNYVPQDVYYSKML